MRILLVTLHENFPYALLNVLNPANEFCAIVTDEVEPAKNFCEKVGLNKNLIFQMYELKECIKNFYYDYAILFSDGRLTFGDFPDEMRNYGLPKNKFVHIAITNVTEHNPFILETGLRYFEEHSAEVEMFATGMSYTAFCLDTTKFKYKLFNFARASQDLYYDYQVAKRALTPKMGGGARIKYALIGLAPYSFHYDLTKGKENQGFLQYYLAFKDLHNFSISVENYGKLFREEFFKMNLPLKNFDRMYLDITPSITLSMNFTKRTAARKRTEIWAERYFPETLAENVKILDDYLTLCIEKNVKPIMFLPPVSEGYAKYFNKKMLDEFYYLVREAQKKNPDAIFVDSWNIQNIFSDSDFCDIDHMNIAGAAKFSTLFNNFIEGLEK